MMKLILLLAIAALGCKLVFGRWPWELIARPARSAEINRARTLLGLPRKPNRDQVIEAHRRLVAQVHPDRGGSSELIYEANAARDLLLGQLVNRLSEKP